MENPPKTGEPPKNGERPQEWRTPPQEWRPPHHHHSMPGDMVNARAVRILLECNLVETVYEAVITFLNRMSLRSVYTWRLLTRFINILKRAVFLYSIIFMVFCLASSLWKTPHFLQPLCPFFSPSATKANGLKDVWTRLYVLCLFNYRYDIKSHNATIKKSCKRSCKLFQWWNLVMIFMNEVTRCKRDPVQNWTLQRQIQDSWGRGGGVGEGVTSSWVWGKKKIISQDLCQKLHENERNWTQSGVRIHSIPSIRQSNFPVIHKVGNLDISVQILMTIN